MLINRQLAVKNFYKKGVELLPFLCFLFEGNCDTDLPGEAISFFPFRHSDRMK